MLESLKLLQRTCCMQKLHATIADETTTSAVHTTKRCSDVHLFAVTCMYIKDVQEYFSVILYRYRNTCLNSAYLHQIRRTSTTKSRYTYLRTVHTTRGYAGVIEFVKSNDDVHTTSLEMFIIYLVRTIAGCTYSSVAWHVHGSQDDFLCCTITEPRASISQDYWGRHVPLVP